MLVSLFAIGAAVAAQPAQACQPGQLVSDFYRQALVDKQPKARWEILRVIADRDLVALHARFTPAPGAGEYALADFFRVKDCKIVEHWDVVAGPVKDAVNPNSRF